MTAVDLITYRARARPDGIVVISQSATTVRDQQVTGHWQRMLEPWLRAGDPQGVAYLDFRSEAAFITWQPDGRSGLSRPSRPQWQQALAFVGSPAGLTGTYALELPDQARAGMAVGGGGLPPADGTPGPRHDAIEARARSAEAITALTPLLGHALAGAPRVTMPWAGPALAEAVTWGLITILRMTGDRRPVSFLTHAPGVIPDKNIPGMLVSFRVNASEVPPPATSHADLAANLAGRFADDPAGLRRTLEGLGVLTAAGDNDRKSRLLTVAPRDMPARNEPGTLGQGTMGQGTFNQGGTGTVNASIAEPAGPAVMCPMCLGAISNWDTLEYWRWDATAEAYVKIDMPPDLNPTQRARFTFGAYVRCPADKGTTTAHYLPARYGSFGDPVLLGFVGLTYSGKTHLLATMIGEITRLSDYGIEVSELDRAKHHDFVENSVHPLLTGHKVLPATTDDATTALADAFIVRQGTGPERVVALFDVSGSNLSRGVQGDSTVQFLWIADGLFFVINPDYITTSRVDDETFSNVLSIMGNRHDRGKASAAIVLNKADMVRFDDPVARWLRAGDGTIDPVEFLRESADVYGYLERNRALALARPYQACQKATLHVASPTGGAMESDDKAGKYPRGVTPLRVLRPLVAMLAMTGVITGEQAEQIGV